jgi:hypothetical protein
MFPKDWSSKYLSNAQKWQCNMTTKLLKTSQQLPIRNVSYKKTIIFSAVVVNATQFKILSIKQFIPSASIR